MNIGHFLDVRDLILTQCLKERCVSADKGQRDDQIPRPGTRHLVSHHASSREKPIKAAMLLNVDPGNRDF
jgi:hypothetical protein